MSNVIQRCALYALPCLAIGMVCLMLARSQSDPVMDAIGYLETGMFV
jgi:hypothetical protein